MRDFNFFTDLKPKKKKTTSTSTYVALVVLLVALAIGGSYYYYYMELEEINDDIAEMEREMQDEAFVADLEEAREMEQELILMRSEVEEVVVISEVLDDDIVINNMLINEISMAKPNTVALDTINFNERNVSLSGTATDKDSLARFEHNLRGNEQFEGPFIPNIERIEENTYTFSLSFTIPAPEVELEMEEEVIEEEEVDEDGN